ncbi:unnamed protein product, partial [Mesorhabditis belari]|uniref:Uncharacterized protein n=1 Tax=Mesorhabditis belari TaxID=2138241 RepID=A0AAF3F3E0_9BILA
MLPLLLIFLVHIAYARYQEVDTGDGSFLSVESDDIEFDLDQPYAGRVNLKFGDETNPIGKQSIAFFHGGSYVSVINKGGVKMERKFDGDFCTIRLKDCHCGSSRRERFFSSQSENEEKQNPYQQTYQTPQEDYYTTTTTEATYPTPPPQEQPNRYYYNTQRPPSKKYKKRKYKPKQPMRIADDEDSGPPKPDFGEDYPPAAPPAPPTDRPRQQATPYYTDEKTGPIINRRVSLSPGHDLNIQSIVDFEIGHPRTDCVDLVVQKPRNIEDPSFNNQVFRYFSVLINITNYSPEQVMIYRDVDNVQCNIGTTDQKEYEPKRKRRPFMKTYQTTTTEATTRFIRPYMPERSIRLPTTKGFDYEGKINLDKEYSIDFECSVPYQVYRPTRYDITITLGYEGQKRPESYKSERFGRYNVDCVNYSKDDVDFSQEGKRATCRVGQPREERQSSFGIRRRLFNLDDGLSFVIIGDGEWKVEQDGDRFMITIGHSPRNRMPLTKSHSEYTFGRYTIVIDNFTLKYFTLEQINNRLQCIIGINQRR